MLRSSLFAAGALLLSASAFAQTDATSKVFPAPKPLKNAGTYHMGLGTWTRGVNANFGPDTLYANTCTVGFYVGLSSGETLVDSGRLPGTSSPTNSTSVTGTANNYTIDGYSLAYCTFAPLFTTVVNGWYNAYSPCADASVLTPVTAISVSGLPGDATGSGSCWLVTIDLVPGTLDFSFSLTADQDTVFDGSDAIDNFGWSYLETAVHSLGASGPFMAGDPFGITTGTACPYGDGTAWQNPGSPGTGVGSGDVFETDLGGAFAGCWFFGGYLGGNPYASFYHDMLGDANAAPAEPGVAYANAGGGIGETPCPCGNNNDGTEGVAGCANGAGNVNNPAGGGTLRASGTASVSASTVVLAGANLQWNQPGLYFQANNAINGGAGVPFGDGLRAAGGGVVRLEVRAANNPNPGESFTTVDMGATATVGATLRYQLWYRNPGVSLCGAGFNFTNGYEIVWGA